MFSHRNKSSPLRSDGDGSGSNMEHMEGAVHRSFIRSARLFRSWWPFDTSTLCIGGGNPSTNFGRGSCGVFRYTVSSCGCLHRRRLSEASKLGIQKYETYPRSCFIREVFDPVFKGRWLPPPLRPLSDGVFLVLRMKVPGRGSCILESVFGYPHLSLYVLLYILISRCQVGFKFTLEIFK